MQSIPLLAVPSQTLQVQVDGQNAQINVYAMATPGDILAGIGATADTIDITADSTEVTADSAGGLTTVGQTLPAIYFDLLQDGAPIVTGRIARNLVPLLLGSAYQGFQGDFVFVDTQAVPGLQGGTDPVYTGLGTRYQLVYLSPTDLQ